MNNSQLAAADRKGYFLFLIIFLAMLSAFGPFVTDMYLPTLPSMVHVFNTTESMVQLGLTTAMIGLALGQVFFGPFSEKYGRRSMLIFSMIIFSVSALASVFSKSIEFFLMCRLFQGIGGSGGIVISRSISTDRYSGKDLAKIMAIIGAVQGVAPVAAPVIGGLVAGSIGWKGIFVILLAIGVVLLAMCFKFEETLPVERRLKGSILSTFNGFSEVLKVRRFVMPVLVFVGAQSFLFAYISSSAFVVQNTYGYSELMFSVLFAINALGIGLGAGVASRFKKLSHAMLAGAIGLVIFSIPEFAAAMWMPNFWTYEIGIFFGLLSCGIIFTSSTTMAMEAGRVSIGAASAIVGASGFLIGGIVSPLVGIGDILLSTSIVFLFGSVLSIICALYVWSKYRGQSML